MYGGEGGGSVGEGGEDEATYWGRSDLIIERCSLLWYSWFVMSICAPISFLRLVNYLALEYPRVGVLMQSLTGIAQDVVAFSGLFLTVVAGFCMFTMGVSQSVGQVSK